MKLLYMDAGMGAAGDMLTAALYELLPEMQKKEFLDKVGGSFLPGVTVVAEPAVKCGVTGTHISVRIHGAEEGEVESHETHAHEEHPHHKEGHHHPHTRLCDIERLIDGLDVSDGVKENAKAVYQRIAEAESRVHHTTVTEVHFHEVGMMDAISDVVNVCLLMEMLSPDRVVCSPVHVGSGTVYCAHGILPVPAPATALLLEGIPIYSREEVQGELCTPTGATLLRHFVDDFGPMPRMTADQIGYGMGKKDFPIANCLRVFYGTAWEAGRPAEDAAGGPTEDVIIELSCNLDDMTGEAMGYCIEKLMEAGARDAFVTSVIMKKNRPGMLLTVLCDEAHRQAILEGIFLHTTTIGIRETIKRRYVLERETGSYEGNYGRIRTKRSFGYGVSREKPEYEDVREIADREGISLAQAGLGRVDSRG